MNDGYKSRKFRMTVVLCCVFTGLLVAGTISEQAYTHLMGGLILFYTAGNVGEKFAK